jgi:LmbE family N-acetylglucosaminyl deacetylase
VHKLADMPDDWESALAIVAHPDDVEYAAGPAVATWVSAGKSIAYLLATRGECGISGLDPAAAKVLREREQRASAAAVGVHTVEFLDHPDGLVHDEMRLRREFAHAIRRHQPDLVLTINHRETWRGISWNTPDHRIVGRAALDAVADAANEFLFPAENLLPWEGVRWQAVAGSPTPTHGLDVSTTLEPARQAVLAHRAYLEALTDEKPEDYVDDLVRRNTTRAAELFGGVPAVAFELFARDAYRVRDGRTHYR